MKNLINIMNFKMAHPNVNSFRNIRYCSCDEYTDILTEIKSNRYISSLMDEEYFPTTIEKMCKTEMNYNPNCDNSIRELVVWGSYLLESYADKINVFLKYKDLYETSLFNGRYKAAHKWLSRIQNEVCTSMWECSKRFCCAVYKPKMRRLMIY